MKTGVDPPDLGAGGALDVLVVDDSASQRRLLTALLSRWGYRAHAAGSAEEALALLAHQAIDVVLSDWMMPGISGPEFCRSFRRLQRDGYGYFILLTSKSATFEIALGLEAGADDFLTKPVNSDELRARLRAGGRIIAMQAELLAQKMRVEQTLKGVQQLYDSLDRDLHEARKLQQTLLRDTCRSFAGAEVHLMMRPSGHIGGDLVGCFLLDVNRLAIWAVDVSGHGVASAMMTARLAGHLAGGASEQNLAFGRGADGQRIPRSPAEVMRAFNRLMLEDLQVEQYFTMAYADIDLATGALRLAQAGHPHPVMLRQGGRVERLGQGGLPIGLIPDADFQEYSLSMRPGDRLLLMSDGITECPDPLGQEFGEDGVEHVLHDGAALSSADLLEDLLLALARYAGDARFPDDVSALILDYHGRNAGISCAIGAGAAPVPAWRDPPDCQGFVRHD